VTSVSAIGESVAVEFLNTIRADRDGLHDALDDPDEVTIARIGDLGTDFRAVRDAMRRLAAEATGDDRPAAASSITSVAEAVAVLNRASASAPTWPELTWSPPARPVRTGRSAHPPAAAALSAIAAQAVELFTGPDRAALRACPGPGCVRYFVRDHPRREWCSDTCGNRARVARHYRRHHATAAD
jgi:predicted RNA-binding Zn ribbon-like protein